MLKQQAVLNAQAQPEASGAAGEESQPRSQPDNGSDSDEFNTPEGSHEGSSEGEQGPMSPHASGSLSQTAKTRKRDQMILDGELVAFKDFDILECIGEGSFGRVFKCRKRDNG